MDARISYRIPTVVGVNKGGRVKPGGGKEKKRKKKWKRRKKKKYIQDDCGNGRPQSVQDERRRFVATATYAPSPHLEEEKEREGRGRKMGRKAEEKKGRVKKKEGTRKGCCRHVRPGSISVGLWRSPGHVRIHGFGVVFHFCEIGGQIEMN